MRIIEAPSPNHSARPGHEITAIILHDTGGQTVAGTLSWFANPASGVSAHYVIDRDGAVYRCVPDARRAWHAGVSVLHGRPNVNDYSIGIELVDRDDAEPYPAPQMAACIELVAGLCQGYAIALNCVVGHADVAVPHGRKVDPGGDWPWHPFLLAVARAHDG